MWVAPYFLTGDKMIKSILVDNREPPHVRNISFPNVPVMKMTLETGDLWVKCEDGNTLIIERKEATDLMASIADNRLFNQAAKMRQVSNWCYVVVTGKIDDANFIDDTGRKWTYASIWGALLSVQEMGVMIIFCDGEDDFAPCIERLAKRNRGDIKVKPVRNAYVFGGQEAVLASLPGIGAKKAVDYLKMFDSLGESIMMLCSPESAKAIPGWGEKSAQNLKDFFQW
jgi:ERCC4-type nuclease